MGKSRPCSRKRSRGSAATVNPYLADVYIYTEPAMTTPLTRREHYHGRSSLPLGLFPVMLRGRRDASPCILACVLAISSQNYRPTTGRSSWATHAPVLAVIVR
jgi:hypothetical protein